MKVLLFCC